MGSRGRGAIEDSQSHAIADSQVTWIAPKNLQAGRKR
jgi:hypothetical protein